MAYEVEASPLDQPTRSRTEGLVERAQQGDEDAWEQLYRMAYPRMLAYARRRLPGDDAGEAVGEAMTRAVAGIGNFRWKGGGFDAWLFGILRYVVLDAQRRSYRVKAFRHERPISSPEPDEALIADEEAAAVRRAFNGLSAKDQELLELRVVAGLNSDEVAAVLGKRAGAVRMAQARALERLRHLLEER